MGNAVLPLHVRLANSAFDLGSFCAPGSREAVPTEILSPAFSPDAAYAAGLISE